MDYDKLFEEAKNMSKWEKIDSGTHDFILKGIERRQTDKSKRDAIIYNGTIKNSKGVSQIVNVVDIIDNEEGFKFGTARLIQFIKYFGGSEEGATKLEDLIYKANSYVGGTIKLEFVKKIVNGGTIKEKVFIYNK